MNNTQTSKVMNVRTIALLGIMTAIVIILSTVPGLGFIPIGTINATIIHIPVIILAIVEGPIAGGILGFMFGLVSFLNALTHPTPFSFMFMNPLIAFVPRILIGVLTGLAYKAMKKKQGVKKLAISISAGLGSLVNTVGVLGLIYIIYGKRYLDTFNVANGTAHTSAFILIGTTAVTNGLVEMIVSVIIATPICYALLKSNNKR